MLPEWQAHIDELLERYGQKRGRLRDVQRAVDTARATVTTEDEMIMVTVDPRGRLVGLEFNPRVYRRMSPSELAAAVLAAAGEASSRVDGQLRAALAPLRPAAPDAGQGSTGGTGGGVGSAGARQGQSAPGAQPARGEQAGQADAAADVGLARTLPERPDDLDAFRERYGLRAGPGPS
jgi:DNA-binding protein YbaB